MGNNRKKYNFASVGETNTVFVDRLVDVNASMPIGIKTPMEMGYDNSGPFRMHTNLEKQIKDNFRNMLQTNHGDRLMIYDFGANLASLAFDLTTEAGDTSAINRIRNAASKYMPFINLSTFESVKKANDDSGLASVGIRITYTIPTISTTTEHAIEVIIHSAG